jgi:hypothetical protein
MKGKTGQEINFDGSGVRMDNEMFNQIKYGNDGNPIRLLGKSNRMGQDGF